MGPLTLCEQPEPVTRTVVFRRWPLAEPFCGVSQYDQRVATLRSVSAPFWCSDALRFDLWQFIKLSSVTSWRRPAWAVPRRDHEPQMCSGLKDGSSHQRQIRGQRNWTLSPATTEPLGRLTVSRRRTRAPEPSAPAANGEKGHLNPWTGTYHPHQARHPFHPPHRPCPLPTAPCQLPTAFFFLRRQIGELHWNVAAAVAGKMPIR